MKVTSCLGSERSLVTCSHTQLGSDSLCNATSEVGVRCIGKFYTTKCAWHSDVAISVVCCIVTDPSTGCTSGDVQLVGGANVYQGTVEVCFYGVWGTVCDSSWSRSDAVVVCRQLGFSNLG